MASRVVPIVLLVWVAIGVVVWLTRGEDADGPVVPEAGSSSAEPLPEPESAPGAILRQVPVLDTSAGAAHVGLATLEQQLGEIEDAAAARPLVAAWLRAHPEEVDRLFTVLRLQATRLVIRTDVLLEGFRDIHDLEPRLSPQLLEIWKTGRAEGARQDHVYMALLAFRRLVPLTPEVRGAIQALLCAPSPPPVASTGNPWRPRTDRVAVDVLFDDARSASELVPVAEVLLERMAAFGRGPAHQLCRRVGEMGPAGAAFIPALRAHVLELQRRGQSTPHKLVIAALRAIGPDDRRAQGALVSVLLTGRSEASQAVEAYLSEMGPSARELLLSALDDEAPGVRLAAVVSLHRRGWAERGVMLPVVLDVLKSGALLLRQRALGMVPFMAERAEDVMPTLSEMFRSEDEADWAFAAKALDRLASVPGGRFEVMSALERGVRHRHAGVRRLIVTSLTRYGERADEVVPLLVEALGDDDATVRQKAADVLGDLAQEDAGALAVLKVAASNRDRYVAETAKAWLEEIAAASKEPASESDDGR